jgi:hypothetical protein
MSASFLSRGGKLSSVKLYKCKWCQSDDVLSEVPVL